MLPTALLALLSCIWMAWVKTLQEVAAWSTDAAWSKPIISVENTSGFILSLFIMLFTSRHNFCYLSMRHSGI